MRRGSVRKAVVLAIGFALTSLGIYNLFLKATWTLMDDGVFWRQAPQGVVAARVAEGGPADRAGLRTGDVLLAVDGREVLRTSQVEVRLAHKRPGESIPYQVLRAEEKRTLELIVRPLSQGNVRLFYYLSLVGFFSLVVGTIVMLRRPPDRAALHFYAICLLFFLMYSISYTGKLNFADWTLFWADYLAILFLPVVFLHFCLSFPERRIRATRSWLIPAAYMPPLFLAGAVVTSQVLFLQTGGEALWAITAVIDRFQPLYFGALFAASFLILLDSYRRARSLVARRQMKWLVLGTGTGVLPFFLFYAIPFTLGKEPRLAMELAGYIPLALIPLSLAYAVVKHRLMDVELIFRRGLVYTLATAAIVGICLLVVGLYDSVLASDEEPHVTLIAILSALVVILLFTPVKSRIQDTIDRLFYRDRYDSRRALLRLSQELNADLDLQRMTDRLLDGIGAALGVTSMAVLLPSEEGGFSIFRSLGCPPSAKEIRLPEDHLIVSRLQAGIPITPESLPGSAIVSPGMELAYFFPCRVRGEMIAILAMGRKEGLDPLNSEEVEVLHALAGQVAAAFLNGRLYQSLREKAEELQSLTEYNENILESMDSGILVVDLEGRVTRWNRSMESLTGQGRDDVLARPLEKIFPAAFNEALRGSLASGRSEEIAHIYKLHLPTADGRSLMVNVSAAPFQVGTERAGTILILDDVTARVRLEEQLQHSEKMASIGLLAAGVAHEVNTPLTGISSYTQMLREQVQVEDLRYPLLEKIEKQAFRAAKIINNLLNFARSSTAEMEPIDLNRLLTDVLSLVEHQLDNNSVKVRREFAEDLPRIRGNENRIQQVFFNLVLNARDAMPSGGWLTLATRADDDTVIVEVRDTGEGIRREDIKRIYDPFFTTKGIGRGTGLGLSVSYGILQEHGGAIFVDSAPGKGTTFQVALPALQVIEAAQR
jgi:two-component system NtrC family sensor kinase